MKKLYRNLGVSTLLTSLVSIWFMLTVVKKIGAPDASSKIISWLTKFDNIILMILLFIAFLSFSYLIGASKKLRELIFKFRYVIAAVILFLAVLFEVNGSSLGILGIFLNNTDQDQVLLGVSRTLRSDEWSVNLPFQISQSYNHYNYYSSLIRGGGSDTFILSGLASWDFATLFRPANLGFLFLGFERGLSFLWSFKIIFLFMSTFELGRIITKDDRRLSLFLSLMVTFSSVIQWWFGMIEMIAAGGIFIILLDKYMKTNEFKFRFIYMVCMSWAGAVFILTFYPAWQVPIAYIYLVLLVFVIFENYKKFYLNFKLDTLFFFIMLILIFGSCFLVLSKAWPTVEATMNTVYPGNRVSFGGGAFDWIFDYVYQIFYPMTDIINERAMDSVYDLFPITQILSILVILKTKDKLLMMLMAVDVLFLFYITFSIPTFIARITLLTFTTPARILSVFGILNLIILIRLLSLTSKGILSKFGSITISACISMLIVLFSRTRIRSYMLETIGGDDRYFYFRLFTFVAFCMLTAILYFIFRRNKNGILLMGLSISFLAGVLANPVRVGSDVVTESALVKMIKEVNQESPGLWIVEGGLSAIPYNNVPLLGGAAVLNSTNPYPNLSLWKKLDKQGNNEEVYNRFAHISFNLVTEDSPVSFQLNSPDSYSVSMPISYLNELDIQYIMTGRDLSEFNNENYYFELKNETNGIRIYKIHYTKDTSMNEGISSTENNDNE